MKLIKFHTENFESEARKIDEVVIRNETIPAYEISVNPKDLKSILNAEDRFEERGCCFCLSFT